MNVLAKWLKQNLMCTHSFKRRSRTFRQSANGRSYHVCVACAVCGKRLSPGIELELMPGRVKVGVA